MRRKEYNSERPLSSLGYRTPSEFAETLRSSLLHWIRKSRQVPIYPILRSSGILPSESIAEPSAALAARI